MLIGAGGLGLWAVKIAQALIDPTDNGVRVYVADHSIDRLLSAQDHGCYDIIHWNEEDHEQYIVERTLDACKGGVDVIVDFVSSPRTVQRDLKVLNRVSRNLFCFYFTYFFHTKMNFWKFFIDLVQCSII
jgi:D-arabinose 1-dehydrogenase-like Zn-dependent alcohol dehydrogenase